MFAFALWDRQDRVLTLARDRLGEKPLYYGWQCGTFFFGSELKALRAHPAFQGDIDRKVLTLYLRHGYIPAPYSIYQGIYKLTPGTFLQLSVRSERGFLPQAVPYWSLPNVFASGLAAPFSGSDGEAINELENRLMQAISLQRVADVPLGAFLSGGIDSSTIVALMQAQSTQPIKTFTIGFHEKNFNEAEHAKAVAKYLGTDHTELYITPREAMDVIPKLPMLYDEPFGDVSAIPTFLVSQLARQHVKVSLSGDGGDELFGGYRWYGREARLLRDISRIPINLRQNIARCIRIFPLSIVNALSRPMLSIIGKSSDALSPGDRLKSLATMLSLSTLGELYQFRRSVWRDATNLVINGCKSYNTDFDMLRLSDYAHIENFMMGIDTMGYLPDDILVKVDRSSMAVGLESRAPLLDKRVVEFAWRIPLNMKIRKGKWLLRQVLYKHVPIEIIDRPKMGFGVPVGSWLRGPLREWAEELLAENRIRQEGILKPKPILDRWTRHITGQCDYSYSLWTIVNFQAWLEDQETRSMVNDAN